MKNTYRVFSDSEYGYVCDVLVCPPMDFSGVEVKQKPFLNYALAARQHKDLIRILAKAGLRCHVLTPNPSCPYQCYMRDSCIITPWGLLMTKMGFAPRQREPTAIETYAASQHLGIWKRISEGTLEGGDVLLLRPGIVLIGFNEIRTTALAVQQVQSWFEYQGWQCRVVRYPIQFRHLDLIVSVLDETVLMCCQEALQAHDLDWLKQIGYTLYDVPIEECINMACNTLNLGDGRIVTYSKNKFINEFLTQFGICVMPVDISEFVRDCGGIHCLVQTLQRHSVAI